MEASSRILFLLVGLLWMAIGLLAPVVSESPIGRRTLFGSPSTDKALYGAPPEEILEAKPGLATFRFVIMRVIAGLLVALGLLVTGIAWFGLPQSASWPLALLTIVGLVVLPYWWIVFAPYREAGIRLGLLDLPPFMWVPGILMPLASILGWVAQVPGR